MLRARWLLAVLCLVALPAGAAGDRYRVDIIVFGDGAPRPAAPVAPEAAGDSDSDDEAAPAAAPVAPQDPGEPPRAVSADEAAALQQRGIQILDDSAFGLQEQWARLKHSSRFRPMAHLSWIQNGAAEHGGTAVRFHVDDKVAGPVDGSFVLNGGFLLHLGAHVAESPLPGDPAAAANRLDETRRLRLDELHYLDSPHIGVLVRVARAP